MLRYDVIGVVFRSSFVSVVLCESGLGVFILRCYMVEPLPVSNGGFQGGGRQFKIKTDKVAPPDMLGRAWSHIELDSVLSEFGNWP